MKYYEDRAFSYIDPNTCLIDAISSLNLPKKRPLVFLCYRCFLSYFCGAYSFHVFVNVIDHPRVGDFTMSLQHLYFCVFFFMCFGLGVPHCDRLPRELQISLQHQSVCFWTLDLSKKDSLYVLLWNIFTLLL